MKPHLYILPFNDNKFLKIGISLNNNFNRINQLSKLYDINHNNVILITSDNTKNIKLLEKNIKTIINETINPDNKYYGKDGHTEIRNVKYLNDIINLINTFKPILNLYELKYSKQTIPTKKINNLHIQIPDNNTTINDICNTLNNLKQYITKINLNHDIISINLNLSNICNNEKELDIILNPLSKSIIINHIPYGQSIRRLNNGYTYDMYFNDVHINIYNSFRLKNEYVNISDEKLQSIYVTFINNLYLNYNHI